MRHLILILLSFGSQQVVADDFSQRSFLLSELRKSAILGRNFNWPFVSQFEVKKEWGFFSSNSGMAVFSAPQKATSAYDPTISYDLSDFYTSRKNRVRLVVNQFIPDTPLMISGGYDSGSSAPKITISPTFFMGLSGYRKLDRQLYFYFTSGAWQKQKVTEYPCVDEYDREYWCPTLIAWSDRPVSNFKPGRFLDLKLEYVF